MPYKSKEKPKPDANVQKLAKLLEDWKLIPKDHVMDLETLKKVVDLDNNGVFT